MEKEEVKSGGKNKKFIIGGAIAAVLLIVTAIVTVLLFTGKEKKITISFDTDGAKSISSIEIKKGESITLPEVSKDGFILDGWYLKDQRVTNTTTFDKDVTLKAKWISNESETFTITFDSDGGSKVDSIKVECGKELSLPTNPSKSGYTFVSWIDKNETPILDKALLLCEDITLKANWKKEETKAEPKKEETKTETKKEETKTETKKEETNQKSYSCPSGYTLNGTKCTTTTSATEECPSGYTWSTKVNKCVAQTTATSECPEGYTWSSKQGVCYISVPFAQCLEGGTYEEYYGYCFYDIFDRNDLGANFSNCEEAGYYSYYDFNCARRRSEPYTCPSGYHHTVGLYYGTNQKLPICSKTADKEVTCPNDYKLYHSDPNFGIGDRCVKLSDKEKICPSDYSLSGSNCIKTIDATYE